MKENLKKTSLFILVSILVFIVLSVLIKTKVLNPYYTRILIYVCINIIVALSLNLILGFTGQLTLGHSAFMSIGAYTAAMLTIKLHTPFLLTLILGGVFAGALGFLIGLPTLRLKGDYLAITTLGFCQIIVVAIQNISALGGAQGLTGIPPKSNFTWVYFSMILTILIIYNIVHSSQGRAMISVREDEIAAEAMGINTTRYKIMAFVVGAFFAGIAGGLYAHYMMYIEPNSFNFLKSIDFVVYVVLGGMGSIPGSIISTALLTYLPEALRSFGDFRMVVYPILLILFMLFGSKGTSLKDLLKKKFLVKGGNNNAVTRS